MGINNLKTSGMLIQSLSTAIICCLAIQTGLACAWPSYNVANFLSNDTVLSSTMSSMHISLLGSLPNVGGLISMPFCGWAFSALGRKYSTMLFGLPYVISWSIISLSNDVTLILLAVTITGIGIAGQNVSTIFISEIAHDTLKGTLTSCACMGYAIGILISNTLGGYLEYRTIVIINLMAAVVTILLLSMLPESPVYLVLVGKEEEAAKSISFYQCLDVKSKEVEAEIRKITLTTDPRLNKITPGTEGDLDLETAQNLMKKLDKEDEKQKIPVWKLLLECQSSKRALKTILVIIVLNNLMGCNVLLVFAEPLFAVAVPSMSANQCAIFIALDFLIASLVCIILVHRFGRKTILVACSAVSGICTGLLGLQLQLHFGPNWFTATLIYMYGFVFTSGCAAIPFVLAAEVFLPEVRSFCNTVCFGFFWITCFITVFVFHPLVSSLGLDFVFYIFSFMCFAGTAHTYFYLPEIKGLSVDAIQILFIKQSGFDNK